MESASWGVVLTADEPEALVLANVGWHLSAGAQEVHLYLDRPGDPVADIAAALPRVFVTRCDAAYWATRGKPRPTSQTRRQVANADHALARAKVDWLAHVDADEFLVQTTPLGQEMAAVRELDCELHFSVAERFYRAEAPVLTLFDGIMRLSTDTQPGFDSRIFKANRKFLQRGMTGHCSGKSAVPTGANFRLGIHSSYRGQRKTPARVRQFFSRSTRLYHFDGLTPLHWLIKLARYAALQADGTQPKSRTNQVSAFLENCRGMEALTRFHDGIKAMSTSEIERFRGFGLIEADAFTPQDAIATALGRPIDLSAQSFDAALEDRFADLVTVVRSGV